MMAAPRAHREQILRVAVDLGFDRVGFARADVSLIDDFARYESYLDAGWHGTMGYLARNRSVRRSLNSPNILAGARTAICVAVRYARPHDASGLLPRIASYARGRDYHDHIRRRLRRLASFVRGLCSEARARPMCDTAPVLERAWAVRAGLGFIGKNGMLIVPGLGSYVLLGEVVTTLDLDADAPQVQRCGRCMRCLEACPTQAFVAPYLLDARRCISYLTIEHRGLYDPSLAARVAPNFFGCDQCQERCPFNATPRSFAPPGTPFDAVPQWSKLSLSDLLGASDDEVSEWVRNTPLERLGVEELRRNARIAGANLGADPAKK